MKYNLKNIYPLGLNYNVSYIANPVKESKKEKIKKIYRFLSGNFNSVSFFEKKADYTSNNCKILFYTRLWDENGGYSEQENAERIYINNSRINTIKLLQKYFNSFFQGGVYNNSTAIEKCPELIIPKNKTFQHSYINTMKNSDICIGTMGLHKSIGWKMAEYVAASRGIVCEPLYYEVPGEFRNKKNHYEYHSPEECCEIIDLLIKNPDLLYNMKIENEKYYRKYLHPKKLILNTLEMIDNEINNA